LFNATNILKVLLFDAFNTQDKVLNWSVALIGLL